jgi:hypothetical protein
VAELPLDVALIGLCRRREAGAQRMSGKLLAALGFGEVTADAGGERRALDQPGDVTVGQPVTAGLLAAPRNRPGQRPVGDAAKLTLALMTLSRP